MDAVRNVARALRAEARRANERRLLVLTGERVDCEAAARAALEATDLSATTLSDRDIVGDRLPAARSDRLLGTTHDCVVVDCHDACRPNAIGRAAGTVDGGGLLLLLVPDLDRWPDRRDEFDEGLAVPPFGLEDVAGRFRTRLVETLRAHRGVAIVEAGTGIVRDDGLTDPAPRHPPARPSIPDDSAFPPTAYEHCLTTDQIEAVRTCESLRSDGTVVIEADRGRGKSSAAGLAAGALAAEGRDVLVTAPGYRNAAELFERARELLDALGSLVNDERDGDARPEILTADGSIRFRRPTEVADLSADVLIVDEAAAIPVRVLEAALETAAARCFATTIHGYEGAGRGFDIRFRDRLDDVADVRNVTLSEPIRYASGDPVEVWLFRALLLDAAPPVDQLVETATPESVAYLCPDRRSLLEEELRLRELFGLLVSAHYRTEPNDLARLLDAPNVAVRALVHDDNVVAVALLAREGGLDETTARRAYEGARIRGNMLPDVMLSQLRDPDAGRVAGLRVMRIATHAAVRSSGLGSALLTAIREEFDPAGGRDSRFGTVETPTVEWLGVGFGATPRLLSFWRENGYRTIHLSTTRNDRSGEYSALMIDPLSDDGEKLAERHARWFTRRIVGVLSDPLDDADPDVVRAALAAAEGPVGVDLPDLAWRTVASAAYGPGLFDVAPGPFRRIALRALVDGTLEDPDAERLLVRKVLQGHPWSAVADELDYVSRRECMRALGAAYRPLVDRYGTETARNEANRYR